ncbi:unnamed protein product, partial [Phaeothamnion confervicola]
RQRAAFEARKLRLLGDHVFISVLGCCAAWAGLSLKAAASYCLGALFGTFYLVLLSRRVAAGCLFVESIGEGDGGTGGGGPARLALVGALVLICGKNREALDVVPAVTGLLMYQVAALLQGLYDD